MEDLKLCLCCKETNFEDVIDLRSQPLSNNFINKNDNYNTYPLKLVVCTNCFHCQLTCAVSPDILFKNYKYVSGTSTSGLLFFEEFANYINSYKKNINKNILDIACNDGSQLDYFKKLNYNTYGVDPAENLCPIAMKKGHNIICDFWTKEAAEKLPIMDIILSQNVFAHTQYIDNFLNNCKIIMNENTSLFIQTSQKDMIINREFDTIYHEHISFFNVKSMDTLVKRNGLVLNRVLENSIHGNSYIFEIKLWKDLSIYNIDTYINEEYSKKLYDINIYKTFYSDTLDILKNLRNLINIYNKNNKIIGFGASAKGQTLLLYENIVLDYIIDENPLKIGLYSPKLKIPIVDINHFVNDECINIVIIILAWNFSSEIKEKINRFKGNKNIIIIEKYFPNLVIS
jgi:hypothetical protein